MTLVEWVKEVKATGGVPDSGPDTLAALRAAAALCWDEIDRTGRSRDEIAQIGVQWTAAFMVSCARHGATTVNAILAPSDYRQRIFQLEARRNEGVLAQILNEAAATPRPLFDAALLAAGTYESVAPSRRGGSLGG